MSTSSKHITGIHMSEFNRSTSTVISNAQNLLMADANQNPTASLIKEVVERAASIMPKREDDPIDIDGAIAELIRRYSIWIGKNSTLSDDSDHEAWLSSSRKKGWRYWHRYRDMLEREMPPAAIDALDVSTDEVLGQLEDPNRAGTWDRRGLVVGHVQSGKTANYTGLICKSADAGYKIIIILAGLHNNLRSQTQIRLEEGFLGYETSANNDVVKFIGVGEMGRDLEIKPNCATNRTENGDFSTRVANHLAITPEQRPWLFVVKKNKTVLDRLLRWIKNHVADARDNETGQKYVSNLPLLLIDDEADNGSVDTGEQTFDSEGNPDPDHEPKAINSRIRKILHSFAKSAYVGYTATPFANVFIHRQGQTTDEGADLFPKSFIINLAAPSNYVGPTRIFGLKGIDGRTGGLPLMRVFDDHMSEDYKSGWMPEKHDKNHQPCYLGVDALPPSLKRAIQSFVLACASRELRGQGNKHSSMLIHVTRYIQVQKDVHRQVKEYVTGLRQRISRKVDDTEVLEQLKKLWEDDFSPTRLAVIERLVESEAQPPEHSWTEVQTNLADVLSDIEIRMINGKAKDVLDYATPGTKGLKVIAIGGDKLARGLTLEGLCTSYFVRTSKMYDTLMQMGRWFGYRPGYLDLCRLYTTEDLIEWFEHIADASEELRDEFEAMKDSGATPKDYGLRVQSHPVLLVTSPLKMRTARDLQLSFSGEILETVALHSSMDILSKNLDATTRLLHACGAPHESPEITRIRDGKQKNWTGHLWSGVSSDAIADFFDAYTTHPAARKVNSPLIRDFIRSMASIGQLTSWTVFLAGGGSGSSFQFPNGPKVDRMIKRKADESRNDRYAIGRPVSPPDEAIDLDGPAWDAAMALTLKNWNPDPARVPDGKKPEQPIVPNGLAIRHIRGKGATELGIPAAPERGLLILYPLDPHEAQFGPGFGDWDKPIIALGISFPVSEAGIKVKYAVDHLTQAQWAQEYGQVD
jgi:hypothetical protein